MIIILEKRRSLVFLGQFILWKSLTANGELIIMPPTGGKSGISNAGLTAKLYNWNKQTKLGKVFDSSTEFRLPNGAKRCPDASWVLRERWEALPRDDRKRFPPLCPDFVRSRYTQTMRSHPVHLPNYGQEDKGLPH